jgi:ADP-ribose pyrophosphatase YjhB (NUDIX family)
MCQGHPMSAQKNKKTWLSDAHWKLIQKSVPIVCVDLLPIRVSRRAPYSVEAVGLILRDTPHQGQRWCLIGGRMLYRESVQDAISRQITETLGSQTRIRAGRNHHPICIAQYAPRRTKHFSLDPRQHAVSLTYVLELTGRATPQGEAVAYEWFDVKKLPPPKAFGFDQSRLVKYCLRRLRSPVI